MRPGWYSWLVMIAGCLVSMAISVTISIKASETALDRDRAQREQQRRENRVAVCTVVNRMRQAHLKDDGDSEVTRGWADMARIFGCS